MNRNANRLKRFIVVLFSLFITLNCVYAQDAVKKSAELLNKSLILGDYAKAYSYSQFIMRYYAGDEIPEEELKSVQSAVSSYGTYLEQNEQWNSLSTLEEDLRNAPDSVKAAASPSFKKAHAYFKELEEQKELEAKKKHEQEEEEKRLIAELKQREAEKAIRQEKNEDTQKILNIIESQRKAESEKEKARAEEQKMVAEKQLELEKARQDADAAYRAELNQLIKDMNKNNSEAMQTFSSNNRAVMIGFVIFITIFISVIIFLVIHAFKQNRHNQEQMKNTILAMQAMRVSQPVIDVLPLHMQLENGTMSLGSSSAEPNSLLLEDNSKLNPKNPENQGETLKKLLLECKKYGEQIDTATGRKNVTSQVAELVYKISQHLEYKDQDAILYYAAALVYDIGFLNIDSSILNANVLSAEQFELLKTHTTIGENMMFFVPEEHRQLFKDAAVKHHEKLDGSGYPAGLKGERIPYIARVIHVAESYIALISQRQYKEIHDRNFAIEELRNSKKQYDKKIIDALDAIV